MTAGLRRILAAAAVALWSVAGWAALPIILVNSSTGSDTAASGAGPATAITGSAASTSGDGLTVTLDGSPDLSGVATDGSAVIYLADSTAGARNFGKITGVDDGADTVTVADAFGVSLSSLSWAIGGKRASIGNAKTKLLAANNSAAGDAMPGWTIRMESGHAETITATYTWRRAGDTTDGPITLEGASGAATRPRITFSNNGVGFNTGPASTVPLVFRDFDIVSSYATKTSSLVKAIELASNIDVRFSGLRIGGTQTSDGFYLNLSINLYGGRQVFENCEFSYSNSNSIAIANGPFPSFLNCWIHDGGGTGIRHTGNGSMIVRGSIIEGNAGNGIECAYTVATPGYIIIDASTIHDNGSDGVEFSCASTYLPYWVSLTNCNITENAGYGLNFSGSGITAALLASRVPAFRNNNYGTGALANTSGDYGTVTPNEVGALHVDPGYVNVATGNFGITAAGVKGVGYPTTVIGSRSATYTYPDVGASQAQPTGGGRPAFGDRTGGLR